jgi:hypothetical protein
LICNHESPVRVWDWPQNIFGGFGNKIYFCGMKQEIKYANPTETIKGYKDSVIAKSESNDCVVRAFASSCDVDYDRAHYFVKEKFKRQNRKGTPNFYSTMRALINLYNVRLNSKRFEEKDLTDLKVENKTKSATVGQFLKKYKTGTYLVVVRGHAFTIKEGVVIGNETDATKLRRPFTKVYEVV